MLVLGSATTDKGRAWLFGRSRLRLVNRVLCGFVAGVLGLGRTLLLLWLEGPVGRVSALIGLSGPLKQLF